jgi:hypothetical protein
MANTSTKTFMYLLRGGLSETTLSPEQIQKLTEKYMNYIQGLRDKGHFIAGEPLEETGKVLSGERGRKVTDGPFTESKEAVGGYFLIRAKDLSEAVELSRDCPIFANGGEIEVRPIQKIPGME